MDSAEMSKEFFHSQRHPFYERLIPMTSRSFADIIRQGKMVEGGLQSGKIKTMDHSQVGTSHNSKLKKESESTVVYSDPGQFSPVNFIKQQVTVRKLVHSAQRKDRYRSKIIYK